MTNDSYTTRHRDRDRDQRVSILRYVLFTLHRDRKRDMEPLFSIVPVPVSVPVPVLVPVPCSVSEQKAMILVVRLAGVECPRRVGAAGE